MASLSAASLQVMQKGLAKTRISDQHTDCKIICGTHEFNVHKIILISQSDYFEAILRQGTFKEGETGVIRLEALPASAEDHGEVDETLDDPEIIKLMVSYFYHFEYSVDKSVHVDQPESDDDEFFITRPALEAVTHAKVFAAAIKYQVDGLRDLAVENFKWAVGVTLPIHGGFEHCPELVAARQANVTCFAEVLPVVFNSTPEEVTQLRDIVLEILLDNFAAYKSNEAIKEAMSSIPSLGYDLLRRQYLRPPPQATRSMFVFTCKTCRQVRCEHPLPQSNICDRCCGIENQLPTR